MRVGLRLFQFNLQRVPQVVRQEVFGAVGGGVEMVDRDFEIPVDRYAGRSLKRAVKWFRENW